jgi:hypothetical protein
MASRDSPLRAGASSARISVRACSSRRSVRLDAAPRLGPQLVAAVGVHAPHPEQQRVHDADHDHDEREFEGGRHAWATIDMKGLRFAHALT